MEKAGRTLRQKIVKELATALKDSEGLFIAHLEGLTNKELKALRDRLNTISSSFIVVKNAMCKLALMELKMEGLCSYIEGTSAVGLCGTDIVETLKVLVNFGKDHAGLKLQGGFSDGRVLSLNTIKELASLPPRNVILGKFVSSINSPISGFVYTLKGVMNNLVYALEEIRKKRD